VQAKLAHWGLILISSGQFDAQAALIRKGIVPVTH